MENKELLNVSRQALLEGHSGSSRGKGEFGAGRLKGAARVSCRPLLLPEDCLSLSCCPLVTGKEASSSRELQGKLMQEPLPTALNSLGTASLSMGGREGRNGERLPFKKQARLFKI